MADNANTIMPTAMLGYISGLGVTIPDAAEVRKDVENEFRQYLGLGDTWSFVPETILGRLIEAFTLQRLGTLGTNAYVSQQTDLNRATGVFLDALGALFVRNRATGTYAEVAVRIVLNADVVTSQAYLAANPIPSGCTFVAEDGSTYRTTSDYTSYNAGRDADGNAILYVDAVLTATDKGGKSEDGTNVTALASFCDSIFSVSTLSVLSYGTDTESDANFRRRLIASRWTGTSFCESIYSSLMSIDGVRSVSVVENVTSTPKATPNSSKLASGEEFLMSPHSVMITVEGGDTNSNAVAEAIFRSKSTGSVMQPCNECYRVPTTDEPDTVQTFPDRDSCVHRCIVVDSSFGKAHEVVFNTPSFVRVVLKVCVSRNKYTGTTTELQDDIKKCLVKWKSGEVNGVDALSVGSFVYGDEIASAITVEIPEVKIRGVWLCKDPPTGTLVEDYTWVKQVAIMEWEIALVNESECIFDLADDDVIDE